MWYGGDQFEFKHSKIEFEWTYIESHKFEPSKVQKRVNKLFPTMKTINELEKKKVFEFWPLKHNHISALVSSYLVKTQNLKTLFP